MPRLLVIDDEEAICWGLAELARRVKWEVATASTAEQGLALARDKSPDLVLLDVRLPGMDGLAALPKLREIASQAQVVVMTAHGDLGTAVEAVRAGALDYVAKPFELAQIERILERTGTRPTALPAPAPLAQTDGLIGRTAIMQEVFRRIALVAPSDACVMLAGDSGTGKELVARAIHRYSRRSAGPFVAVNIAALSPTVAESELFGHVRGAFTGADQPRQGLLVEAHGGTLFLDEVADIPLPVQVKLLRALEHGEVLPVGSGRPVRTDFRLIAATHQQLPARVQRGEFRHDLYYRLATFQIDLPRLRERVEDIPLLVDHFVRQLSSQGSAAPRVSRQALAEIAGRPWHGNVRELRNAIEHGLILAREGVIQPEHLPPALPPLAAADRADLASAAAGSADEALRKLVQAWAEAQLKAGGSTALYGEFLSLVEPPFLATAMKKFHNQCASAARVLGIHRVTLRKKLDDYGIAGED
jgi:two-component system nitrogen regulation response regulator GlnG